MMKAVRSNLGMDFGVYQQAGSSRLQRRRMQNWVPSLFPSAARPPASALTLVLGQEPKGGELWALGSRMGPGYSAPQTSFMHPITELTAARGRHYIVQWLWWLAAKQVQTTGVDFKRQGGMLQHSLPTVAFAIFSDHAQSRSQYSRLLQTIWLIRIQSSGILWVLCQAKIIARPL
ncbi:hypothetical protein BD289DRAFT_297422 [Coniella lustricola]|uniref:Uncharacterized protein n=1 Tax=Coniella lustricola TaxID=2025994 RepID=A0A2T3A4T1_9PEZI|nr:hypothetical protein BD289DRAFT_297422 [Coniella lustricola]